VRSPAGGPLSRGFFKRGESSLSKTKFTICPILRVLNAIEIEKVIFGPLPLLARSGCVHGESRAHQPSPTPRTVQSIPRRAA
jgi:hypothetical protein